MSILSRPKADRSVFPVFQHHSLKPNKIGYKYSAYLEMSSNMDEIMDGIKLPGFPAVGLRLQAAQQSHWRERAADISHFTLPTCSFMLLSLGLVSHMEEGHERHPPTQIYRLYQGRNQKVRLQRNAHKQNISVSGKDYKVLSASGKQIRFSYETEKCKREYEGELIGTNKIYNRKKKMYLVSG